MDGLLLNDTTLRLAVATLVGAVLGLNRDLKHKPMGMRTLALVALGTALVATASVSHPELHDHPDALSRVLQGVIQGIMAGVGFLGAGVIVRSHKANRVYNLTTAATVWVTAALGIACALSAWSVVFCGVALTLLVLLVGGPLERLISRTVLGHRADPSDE